MDLQKRIKGISLEQRLAGVGRRIGIVHTQWNSEIIRALVSGARDELLKHGVAEDDIVTLSVPGSYELPYGAKCLIDSSRVDAVIALGCLIKGDTMHFEYIAEAVTQGIMRLNLDTSVPVIFGVLTVLTEAQARDRAGLGDNKHNHGVEWAQSALQMASVRAEHIVGSLPASALSHYT